MKASLSLWILSVFFLSVFVWPVSGREKLEKLPEAIGILNQVNEMREARAAELLQSDAPITRETFERVCRPVGLRLAAESQGRGWIARQLAFKFRNPANKPEKVQGEVIKKFQRDPSIEVFVRTETFDDREGLAIYKRIPVQQGCLNCHGPRRSLPEFIKEDYKLDRAYGFNVGDLRGVYWLFIPDKVPPKRD